MQKKTIWITSGAIAAALVLGGVGVAVADPFDDDRDLASNGIPAGTGNGTTTGGIDDSGIRFDDDDSDDDGRDDSNDLTGTDLERASAAALIETDGGTVTDAESSGSSTHAYEVDVRLEDGTDVDVYLDADFAVLGVEAGDDGSRNSRDDDGIDDDSDDRSDDDSDDRGSDDDGRDGRGSDDDGTDDRGSDD